MNDKKMARYYEFQCHAQVLKSHPNIDWLAVVDNDEEKLKIAKEKWGIKNTVKSLNDLDPSALPEIIVMATRPDLRLDVLKHFPHAKGIILEKPLSRNIFEREKILDFFKKSKVKININFNRRFDNALLKIIKKFGTNVGKIQTGTIIYGNGLKNNGIHFIDQIRMILGEVSSVQALNKIKKNKFSNIEDDIDVKFVLNFKNGIQIYVSPIDFSYYREQALAYGDQRKNRIYAGRFMF